MVSEQVLSGGPIPLVHPRSKAITSYINVPEYPNTDVPLNTSKELLHKNKNCSIKNTNSKNKKPLTEKVNGIIVSDESDIEIESESESEYLESDTGSEKSEEIPDESSDNEYLPRGKSGTKKKQTHIVITPPVKLKVPQPKVHKLEAQSLNGKKERKTSFTHDKCDSFDCKIPSGNLKTVTWVQCDDCDAWYHVSCSGLSVADAKREDTSFLCGCS